MRLTYRIAPNIEKPRRKPTTVDTAKVGFFQSSNGTIGWGFRISTKKKTTPMTAATASSPMTSGDVNSWSRVIENPRSSGTSVAASVNAPTKSMSRHDALCATDGRVTTQTAMARMPTGTFT